MSAELAAMPPSEDRDVLTPILERLRRWDHRADTASVETTWFVLARERLVLAERAGGQRVHPRLDALAEALRLLREEWGTVEVPWGRLSRHQRPLPGRPFSLDPGRPSLAAGGGPGSLGSVFTFESAPFGSAAPRIGRGGNSFVKVVAFGPAARAASILNYGQSGDPASAHFFDQAELYAQRRFKPRGSIARTSRRTQSGATPSAERTPRAGPFTCHVERNRNLDTGQVR
jgi:acyl-homoserine-lactone acylase